MWIYTHVIHTWMYLYMHLWKYTKWKTSKENMYKTSIYLGERYTQDTSIELKVLKLIMHLM